MGLLDHSLAVRSKAEHALWARPHTTARHAGVSQVRCQYWKRVRGPLAGVAHLVGAGPAARRAPCCRGAPGQARRCPTAAPGACISMSIRFCCRVRSRGHFPLGSFEMQPSLNFRASKYHQVMVFV